MISNFMMPVAPYLLSPGLLSNHSHNAINRVNPIQISHTSEKISILTSENIKTSVHKKGY